MGLKVLMILGSGGHTAQLIRLSDMLGRVFDYAYLISYDDKLSARKIKIPGEVYFVHRARSHEDNLLVTGFKILRLFVESLVAFLRIRPEAVVSAGPGIAVPISVICKIFGKRVIFIEDWSKVYQQSKTGRVMYHISDLFFVQWPELLRLYPKAIYAGRLA
ncbi:MAG: UDP-N-acetylglucosamine transferase subunit ALG14 [Candidatus Methanomethylicia archaeon]|nr:UDP-N-acetylglucosamine transferase subunit ALG14 [Candidatus Methanomethylicia archaeon]